MQSPRVTGIFVYPIKSCRGIALAEAEVGVRGLDGDRRYMLVDANGRFLTQREHPAMALIDVAIEGDTLRVEAPGWPPLVLPRALESSRRRRVTVWRDTVDADAADAVVDAWFSEYLGIDCGLVYLADGQHRPVSHESAAAGDEVGFADAGPLLLISTGSLDELNRRLERPVEMRRFRPNVVVASDAPFPEDTWRSIGIGGAELDVAWACKRCVLTTIDPETGVRDPDREPLRTLSSFRRVSGGVVFGQNLIPRRLGRIALGDAVEVLARH